MSDSADPSTLVGIPPKGLFSLVEAAAISQPIATSRESSTDSVWLSGTHNAPSSLGNGAGSAGNISKAHTAMKHRRLSSSGQARRRLSDAREANSRPSPVMLQTAAAALSSLATLSLSGSPPPQSNLHTGTSFTTASSVMTAVSATRVPKVEVKDEDIVLDDTTPTPVKTEINGAGISVTKTGKKRGTIFKCESCSKVYRHPSCLIKHRWEHSPHWREASKFLLSKHQQVQLLEAAAILSHLAPSGSGGTSLPEDRSLWPSFLSGGLLPPPDQMNMVHDAKQSPKPRASSVLTPLDQPITYPTSSSVPAASLVPTSVGGSSSFGPSSTATSIGRPPSVGPRMHDYAIPNPGGITQVRPGVVGVPTSPRLEPEVHATSAHSLSSRSAPMPVPVVSREAYREPRQSDGGAFSFVSDAWSSPVSVGFAQSSFRSSVGSAPYAPSGLGRSFSDGAGGWSLPRSSLRSGSLSRSRSGSGSVDMDDGDREHAGEFIDVDSVSGGASANEDGGVEAVGRFGFTSRGWKSQIGNGKIEEEEWDGMEMEMEM